MATKIDAALADILSELIAIEAIRASLQDKPSRCASPT
jgi:hypothetical protein